MGAASVDERHLFASGTMLTKASLVIFCLHGVLTAPRSEDLRKIDLEKPRPKLPDVDEANEAFCKSENRAGVTRTLVSKLCEGRAGDCETAVRIQILRMFEALCDEKFSDSEREIKDFVQKGGDLRVDICSNDEILPMIMDFLNALCSNADPGVADEEAEEPPSVGTGHDGMKCLLWAGDGPQGRQIIDRKQAKDARQAGGMSICDDQNIMKMANRIMRALQLACERSVEDKWGQMKDTVCSAEQPAKAVKQLLRDGCEYAGEYGYSSGMFEVCMEDNNVEDVEHVLKQLCYEDQPGVMPGGPHVQELAPLPGGGGDEPFDNMPFYGGPDYDNNYDYDYDYGEAAPPQILGDGSTPSRVHQLYPMPGPFEPTQPSLTRPRPSSHTSLYPPSPQPLPFPPSQSSSQLSPQSSPYPTARPHGQTPLIPPSKPSGHSPAPVVPPSTVSADRPSPPWDTSDSSSSEESDSTSRPSPSSPSLGGLLSFCAEGSRAKFDDKVKQICKADYLREFCEMLGGSGIDFFCNKMNNFAKGYCSLPDKRKFVADNLDNFCSLLGILADLKPPTKMNCDGTRQPMGGPLTDTISLLKDLKKDLCSEDSKRAMELKADELFCSAKGGVSDKESDDGGSCGSSDSKSDDISGVLDDDSVSSSDSSDSFQMAIDRSFEH